ncbi:hypothetical protein GCM10020221_12890 [Streptomyces thioluteus]|uniref:Uncharacterized protein n=1 Tax=Streptomyces thioluteus TaxID=66431 RepID=A0ABN3WJV7_STRTU
MPDAEAERVRRVVRHRCPGLADADSRRRGTAFDALGPEGDRRRDGVAGPAGLVTATGWKRRAASR